MTKMKNTNSPKRAEYLQGKLEKVLAGISSEGDFKAAIISTLDGFSVAAHAEDFDDVKLSAISAIVQDVSEKEHDYIRIADGKANAFSEKRRRIFSADECICFYLRNFSDD